VFWRHAPAIASAFVDLRIFTEPQQGATYDDLVTVAKHAEALGFDAFFRSDHYMRIGEGDPGPGSTDAWVTLGAIARETDRIRLGTLVTPVTFRFPGPLALQVAQVDQMSGGRVELGLGAGWYDAEHHAYAIPFPPNPVRFKQLEEQLAIVSGLWGTPVGERYSFAGEQYTVTDSPGLPKPVQRPGPPIVMGGWGAKRTPRLAATYAAEFNTPFAGINDFPGMIDNVRRACDDAGRDQATMVVSCALTVCCGKDETELQRRADAIAHDLKLLRAGQLAGTPDELVDLLGRFREAGAQRAYLQLLDLHDLDHLDLIASEVMPHV
jgi:F420-dependent oxidoreductase-like protein